MRPSKTPLQRSIGKLITAILLGTLLAAVECQIDPRDAQLWIIAYLIFTTPVFVLLLALMAANIAHK